MRLFRRLWLRLTARIWRRATSRALKRWQRPGMSGAVAVFLIHLRLTRRAGRLRFDADRPGSTSRSDLIDYLRAGETWKPHPLFDPVWYRSLHPDTLHIPALVHFVLFGFAEGRSPHPLVNMCAARENFPSVAHFFGIEDCPARLVNPFLTGQLSTILLRGETDTALTPYFNAPWIRDHYGDSMDLWVACRTALDLGFVDEALAYWTEHGRPRNFPPSPHGLEAPAESEGLPVDLRDALLADSCGSRLVRLIPTSGPSATFSANYRDATCFTLDRLVVTAEPEPHVSTAHHDELLVSLEDPSHGLKSRNYRPVGGAWLLAEAQSTVRIQGTSIHLLHEYASNYFHAVIEVAGRYLAYLAHHAADSAPQTLLIDECLPRSVQRLIAFAAPRHHELRFLPAGASVVTESLRFPRQVATIPDVYFRQPREREQWIDEDALREIKAAGERLLRSSPAGDRSGLGPRILLKRTSRSRAASGFAQLQEHLARERFSVFQPGSATSLEDQINVFRSAEIVVAPTGAALTNILFMRPGSTAVIVSGDQPSLAIGLWDQLAAISGVRVVHVRGPVVHHGNTVGELYRQHDFVIPLDDVAAAIADAESSR